MSLHEVDPVAFGEERQWLADGAPKPVPNRVRSAWFLASLMKRWRSEVGPIVRKAYLGSWSERRVALGELEGIFTNLAAICRELSEEDPA